MVSILTTLGVGSGVDTTALIDALVAAEQKPRADDLAARSTKVDARISGLAQVKSGLSALVAALASRTLGGALGPLPASSDASIVAASATSGATPLLNPVEIEVKALAGGQTIVSAALASSTAAVGTGVLTLTLGTMTQDAGGGFGFAGGAAAPVDITIDANNNTLAGLRDAINAAMAGRPGAVQASIIADGSGSRLVLKGAAGAASAFILAADPASADDTGLTRFVHTPATSAMTVAANARDASLVVDGVAVTRPSNHFADLIDGVTLDLRRAAVGTVVTVAATRDADGLKTAVRDLVSALNALNSVTAGLVQAGTDATTSGVLSGDSTMRRLRGDLTALAAETVLPGAAAPARLADLGIATARDGSLTIDETKLGAAVAAAPDAVEKLLVALTAPATLASGGGALTQLAAELTDDTTTGTSSRYVREQTAIASDKAALDARMTTYRATLVKQYAAMEAAVAASKSIQSFLETQIKA